MKRLSPPQRLFLLLWRLDLGGEEAEEARRLAGRMREEEWALLARLSLRSGMGPAVYWGLARLGALRTAPEEAARGLRRLALRGAAKQALLQRLLGLLRGALEALGLEGIVTKGMALALRFYPHPSLRGADDLDLLVPKGSLGRLARFLADRGVDHHFHPWPGGRGRSLHVLAGDVEADVDEGFKWFDPLAEDFWRTRQPLDGFEPLSLPSAEMLLLHACLHAVISDHPIPAILPRTVCDLSAILSKARPNWEEVVEVAGKLGVEREVSLALRLAARRLSASELAEVASELLRAPSRAFLKLADRLFEEALSPSPAASKATVGQVREVLASKTPFEAIQRTLAAFAEPVSNRDALPREKPPHVAVRDTRRGRSLLRLLARPLVVPIRLATWGHVLRRTWLLSRALGPQRPF